MTRLCQGLPDPALVVSLQSCRALDRAVIDCFGAIHLEHFNTTPPSKLGKGGRFF